MTLVNRLRLIKWRLKGSKLPIPNFKKQSIIKSIQNKSGYKIFVETGTYLGDMIFAQKNNFKKLYSVELGKELYEAAKKRFQSFPNVNLLQGDSGEVLSQVVGEINEPAIFWLDGHYSGGVTAKGSLNCPIWGELKAILARRNYSHIVLIDDAREFIGKNDYPSIDDIELFLRDSGIQFELSVSNDMIRIDLL